MHSFDIPEKAIKAFESWSKLRVTVHQYEANLSPYLSPDRFFHCHVACDLTKLSGYEARCVAFDIRSVTKNIQQYIPGRVHMCHAGIIEWVVPVFTDDKLQWIFFAGARRPGQSLSGFRKDDRIPSTPRLWAEKDLLLPVEHAESELFLEGLLQLSARLLHWYIDYKSDHAAPYRPVRDRRATIMAYIRRKHTSTASIGELAANLHLSESRTAHLVKELCGKSFIALLHEARIRTAATFLRETNMPVADVARASGFHDIKHFYTIFNREVGRTPGEYRREASLS